MTRLKDMKLKSNKNNNQFIPKGSSACAIGIIDNKLETPSTPVDNVRQIHLKMQNKPNFSSFFSRKRPFNKKTNPIQTQYKANISSLSMVNYENKANSNPNKANFMSESKYEID